jgi:hypothetical protein
MRLNGAGGAILVAFVVAACQAAPEGPWTQQDADAASAAESSIETAVCSEPVWDALVNGPYLVQVAPSVDARSSIADGLSPVITDLQGVDATAGGKLLDPDLASLIQAVQQDQSSLRQPMTQDSFNSVVNDLVAANRVSCWQQTLTIGGHSVGLKARADHIQNWVNTNVKR